MTSQNDEMIPDQGQEPFIVPRDDGRPGTLSVLRDRKNAAAMAQVPMQLEDIDDVRDNSGTASMRRVMEVQGLEEKSPYDRKMRINASDTDGRSPDNGAKLTRDLMEKQDAIANAPRSRRTTQTLGLLERIAALETRVEQLEKLL